MSFFTNVLSSLSNVFTSEPAWVQKIQNGTLDHWPTDLVQSGKVVDAFYKIQYDQSDEAKKKKLWYCSSALRGWEGAGALLYVRVKDAEYDDYAVLGLNKEKGELEYSGGCTRYDDANEVATAQRKVFDEFGLKLDASRFRDDLRASTGTAGTTGFPAYVYLIEITNDEYQSMKLKTSTFSKLNLVPMYQLREYKPGNSLVTKDGFVYQLRSFNRYTLEALKKQGLL